MIPSTIAFTEFDQALAEVKVEEFMERRVVANLPSGINVGRAAIPNENPTVSPLVVCRKRGYLRID